MISKVYSALILSLMAIVPANLTAETFVYSGGCFWCTEADSEKLEGVSDVISGFTGGTTANPVYQVGKWGDHREAAQVIYDPAIISFEELVTHVYATIDYEDLYGQFCDRGRSYSPAIYYKSEAEKFAIEKLAPASSVVPIEPETKFYPVRTEHQGYYKKNPMRYTFYRNRCKRDQRIKELAK